MRQPPEPDGAPCAPPVEQPHRISHYAMKVSVRNLGVLRHAEFELGDLTLICGDNNTGKTYATYALYGFLSRWRNLLSVAIPKPAIVALSKHGLTRIDLGPIAKRASEIIRKGCEEYQRELSAVFATTHDHFEIAEFLAHIDDQAVISAAERAFERKRSGLDNDTIFSFIKASGDSDLAISLLTSESHAWPAQTLRDAISDTVIDLLFGSLFPRPFIASAERTGATMFRPELSVDPLDVNLFLDQVPDYPLPVTANVDFARRIGNVVKRSSYLADDHPHVLREFSDVVGGDYVVEENSTVRFQPTRQLSLTMDESSSSVRALLDIGLFLRHVARPGDLLMVDEPELNLHPRNQRRMARLFARLANLGIRVFATTHSDYIVKELNTLIMLNHDKPHLCRLAEREGYQREELVTPDQLRVYVAVRSETGTGDRAWQDYTLAPAPIDHELGIEARSFDETINEMNEIQDAIMWGDDE